MWYLLTNRIAYLPIISTDSFPLLFRLFLRLTRYPSIIMVKILRYWSNDLRNDLSSIFLWTQAYSYSYIFIHTHTYSYILIHTHTYSNILIYTHTCMYEYIWVCMYVWVYSYILIHTSIHTHTYEHTNSYILAYIRA